MNKIPAILVVFPVAMLLLGALPSLAGIQDFTLVNSSGLDIPVIKISEDYSDEWGPNVLGANQILLHGTSLPINFSGGSTYCNWDMYIENAQGQDFQLMGMDLCVITKVVIYSENGQMQFCAQ
ncbi:MAG: hypothetical protein D6E12_11920 [Desulfovibrio sp.]|nr:MAG: hypothetical protein D6E12_11920 [Desulfovibrio sp.]